MAALSRNGAEAFRLEYLWDEKDTKCIVSFRSNGKVLRRIGRDGWRIVRPELARRIADYHAPTEADYQAMIHLLNELTAR